jgi:hypothetical protein
LIAVVAAGSLALVGPGVRRAYCDVLMTLNPELTAACIPEPTQGGQQGGDEEGGDDEGGTQIQALAAHRPANGNLIVMAKIPKGSTATLSLQGFGPMQRLGQSNVFKFEGPVSDPPETVTILSSDGGSITVDVR